MEFHCLDVAQFNHSVERYLDYLHLFAFTSYAAINACVCTSFGRSMHNLFSIVYTSPRKRWICRKCFELFWSAAYIFGLKVMKAGSQKQFAVWYRPSTESPVSYFEPRGVFFWSFSWKWWKRIAVICKCAPFGQVSIISRCQISGFQNVSIPCFWKVFVPFSKYVTFTLDTIYLGTNFKASH